MTNRINIADLAPLAKQLIAAGHSSENTFRIIKDAYIEYERCTGGESFLSLARSMSISLAMCIGPFIPSTDTEEDEIQVFKMLEAFFEERYIQACSKEVPSMQQRDDDLTVQYSALIAKLVKATHDADKAAMRCVIARHLIDHAWWRVANGILQGCDGPFHDKIVNTVTMHVARIYTEQRSRDTQTHLKCTIGMSWILDAAREYTERSAQKHALLAPDEALAELQCADAVIQSISAEILALKASIKSASSEQKPTPLLESVHIRRAVDAMRLATISRTIDGAEDLKPSAPTGGIPGVSGGVDLTIDASGRCSPLKPAELQRE